MKKTIVILLVLFSMTSKAQNSASEFYESARKKIDSKDYTGAIADLNQVIKLDSKHTKAFMDRGTCKSQLGDERGALEDYKTIIKNDLHYEYLFLVYYNIGGSYGALKKNKEAIINYTKCIELNPDYGFAYNNRGLLKIKTGDKDGGCIDLSKAGEKGDSEAYKNIKLLCGN